ncbi:MAG: hypothetical protein ACD_79C01131G0006 [uncultured bacterium]|nr:MAG: hypothetical protein ACD_79C01131G0006 [uncultured bacterium]
MKLAFVLISVVSMLILSSGCENIQKNTRQTGKNINSLLFDGYDKDLYTAR